MFSFFKKGKRKGISNILDVIQLTLLILILKSLNYYWLTYIFISKYMTMVFYYNIMV